jgi:pimeloyl-ACP methyl ester carboxylesterase
MPAHYIHGTLDSAIIPESLNQIEDCFDSLQVETIPAAHFVQEEKPREVAQLMNVFFQKEKHP